MGPGSPFAVSRGRERSAAIEALAARAGGRVGLTGVLENLDRRADVLDVRRSLAAYAFAWDRADQSSPRWWPQGISTSADAGPSEEYAGRKVVVTTSYSKVVRGLNMGSRISVADVTDPRRVRYGHLLLVAADLDGAGALTVSPLRVHAGGVVWHGPYFHVAATARGFYTFHVDDVISATATSSSRRPGLGGDGPLAGYGHRYLLPVRYAHTARTDGDHEPLRYSFMSLTQEHATPRLLVGEYGRGRMTTRLVSYDLDATTALPSTGPRSMAWARCVEQGVRRMQGAVEVDGRYYVTTSAGRRGRGSIWVGAGGALLERRGVLPAGPEDLAYWPSADQLWTVTEHPRRRVVLAMDRGRLG